MNATLSILGLYEHDTSILDGFTVPDTMDKQRLFDYILMECADLELLYPNWDIMKRLIASWSTARLSSWAKLYESTVQQFNMIHNYDRYEEWLDSSEGNDTSTDTTNSSSSGRTSTSKAAYNSTPTLTPTEEVTSSATTQASGTGTRSTTGESTHSGHLYGNIGVTTAADMLEGVRELYRWDVYQAIAQEFKQRFCVLVY